MTLDAGSEVITPLLVAVAALLIAIALRGIQTRQAERSGRLGRVGLTVATIGVVTFAPSALIYVPIMLRGYDNNILFEPPVWLQLLLGIGGSVLLVGLAVFGIATARANIFPRWAAVMLAVGIPLGIAIGLLLGLAMHYYLVGSAFLVAGDGLFVAGLIRLGYALWEDAYSRKKLTKQLPVLVEHTPLRRRMLRTGFGDKTIWDWLGLLIVPIVIAVAGFWFTEEQAARQDELEEQRAQDTALQAYLDKISDLMLRKDGGLRQSEEGDEVRTLARARTLTVLARLDPSHKREVIRFLSEANLVQNVDGREPVLRLSGADLSGAKLAGTDLSGAYLNHANLRDAYLGKADLSGAHIRNGNLRGAYLGNADLRSADLEDAELFDADLNFAHLGEAHLFNTFLNRSNLTNADLSDTNMNAANVNDADLDGADLQGANLSADFSGADLSEAEGVSKEQLEREADFLEGAIMPDGTSDSKGTYERN